MSFISYAQNFEDVMLWRALKQVEGGFYIDVGAAWSEQHSVTKAFYDRGWNGINIEPDEALYRGLEQDRPRDINLRTAMGAEQGTMSLQVVSKEPSAHSKRKGASRAQAKEAVDLGPKRVLGVTTLDGSTAEHYRECGYEVQTREIPVSTLATICAEHVPADQPVHFLKVDVEGFERSVLQGMDWRACRPWLVVVEATKPALIGTGADAEVVQEETFPQWEDILTGADYRLIYKDGLNGFYVAQERADELGAAFKYPPNRFDDFVLVPQVQLEKEIRAAALREGSAKARMRNAKVQAAAVKERLEAHQVSLSWRLTEPLRWSKHRARILRAHWRRMRVEQPTIAALTGRLLDLRYDRLRSKRRAEAGAGGKDAATGLAKRRLVSEGATTYDALVDYVLDRASLVNLPPPPFDPPALVDKCCVNLTEQDLLRVDSNADFVRACYLKLLDRPAEAPAVVKRTAKLDGGYARKKVIAEIMKSAEFRTKGTGFDLGGQGS